MKIDIIGAGIGGLTMAIALEKKGFTPTIYEQTEQIKPVGAGILLGHNAMQVFEKLGLRTSIEANGNHITDIVITKPNLKQLSKVDLAYFDKRFNVKNTVIHRGVLQQILIDQLKTTTLVLGHKLKTISKTKTGHKLEFYNGKIIQSETLIAADGIHSNVRTQLFTPVKFRHANQMCWRGIAHFNLPRTHYSELNEAWGTSSRFGFVQIDANKVYWYALKSFKKDKTELSQNSIETYYNNYDSIIQNIIKATPKEQINTAEIIDFKPISNWHNKNVCLIGDAAHALTPNMGQGACQAIEDAFILAECMAKHDMNKAFELFQHLRLPKANLVVKASWVIGKMAHIPNPVLIELRNQIMRLTPAKLNRKQTEKIFELPLIE